MEESTQILSFKEFEQVLGEAAAVNESRIHSFPGLTAYPRIAQQLELIKRIIIVERRRPTAKEEFQFNMGLWVMERLDADLPLQRVLRELFDGFSKHRDRPYFKGVLSEPLWSRFFYGALNAYSDLSSRMYRSTWESKVIASCEFEDFHELINRIIASGISERCKSVDDFDTLFVDFSYRRRLYTLIYNIYEGITLQAGPSVMLKGKISHCGPFLEYLQRTIREIIEERRLRTGESK